MSNEQLAVILANYVHQLYICLDAAREDLIGQVGVTKKDLMGREYKAVIELDNLYEFGQSIQADLKRLEK